MIWYLFFVLFLIIISTPIPLKFELSFDILHLKGEIKIKLINFNVLKTKVYVKNGYIFIQGKKHTRKEKLSIQNPNLQFFTQLIKSLYFRQQLVYLKVLSNLGYCNDAFITAMMASFNDILAKCLLAKIKNNKKSAHIFIETLPNYNEDKLYYYFESAMTMSLFDLIFAFLGAKISQRRDYGQNKRRKQKQNRVLD